MLHLLKYISSNPFDSTIDSLEILTANSAIRLMTDCDIRLSKWSELGAALGVPADKREEFRQQLGCHDSLEECLEYWIRNVPGKKT